MEGGTSSWQDENDMRVDPEQGRNPVAIRFDSVGSCLVGRDDVHFERLLTFGLEKSTQRDASNKDRLAREEHELSSF